MHTQAMADKYFICIIGEMDRLWFHRVILFSEPTAKVAQKPIEKPASIADSLPSPSSTLSLSHEETSTDESPPQKQVSSESISVPPQDYSINIKEEKKERLARMNYLGSRIRSQSSSPSSQHIQRKFRKHAATTTRKLRKSMSCRTLGELELDEVKGFMDLGFIFKRETLSPRMMSVVPGLQRLGLHQNKQHPLIGATETVQDNDIEAEEKRDIMRPYLSEAWLIKRPDSPLLNLRIPKPCSASNMKKHLRFWAKTVASEIHQE